MKTGFLGQAYASRSPILSSQSAINVYPELTETKGSEVGGFYGTPGLESIYAGPYAEVRGLWRVGLGTPGNFYLFAVIGNIVYRFDRYYNATNLGTLPNSQGRVSMVDNGTQVAIAHQSGMHWVAVNGSAIAPVAGAPLGAILSATDNYVLFTENVGGQFGITALGDLSSIDPLDVATAEGWPDDCVSLICDHREVVLLGTETIEVWEDTGGALFPFQRVAFIEQGCIAKFSVAKLDNSVFWLGRDRNGKGVVYRSNVYIPVRISTFAIESEINDQGDISDAIGFAYQEEGHLFYVLTFPGIDQTWVYDVATKMWHQRAWMDASGVLHRHRANCHAAFYDDQLIGDWQNGIIYRQSLDLTDDDGSPIYRERAWEIPDTEDDAEHARIRVDKLEVLALTGDGDASGGESLMWLRVSKDAGRTFGHERYQPLGLIGQFKARCRWRRLGIGRDWVFKVATTMKQRVSWVAAFMEAEKLAT